MKYTIKQTSKVTSQGEQKFIIIQKKYHEQLKEKKLLGKDLQVTLTFEDVS